MINEFIGENAFLSNFALVKINHLGFEFNSVENAYAASKCKYIEDVEKFINISSGQAKRLGRRVANREDWDEVKVGIMRSLLEQKFQQEPFKSKLIETSGEIVEGNSWGDTFWGVDIKSGIGKNTLGKLIMEIRNQLLKNSECSSSNVATTPRK